MKNEKWFTLDIPQIEKKLKTNAASGLSLKAARSRWNHTNGSLFIPLKKSPWVILGSLLSDFALILLLLTAIIALFFDDSYSVISILIVAFVNLCVSFVIYYRSQRTLESMESFYRPTARVIRGGKLYNMDYRYVVLGDVLLLERGDIVCADIRLVTSDSLAVSMRTNEKDYVYLEKFSDGMIRPNENDAKKYTNIIHAGSVIENGNARGIVTAVGKYTYLGAMTGGILESDRDKMPTELRSLKKFCSRFSMISLLAVLPFCIISFFLSQTQGAEVTLSVAFLTALAISASAMSQIATTLCKIFFINNIKKLIFSKDPAAVRSSEALDKFSRADYLFVLDGSPFSDGEFGFETAITFDGEINNFESLSVTDISFANAVGIYTMADKRSLSSGISKIIEYEKGIDEFFKYCKIDREALNIRYSRISHYPMVMQNVEDSVIYTENGEEKLICISYTASIISECQEVCMGMSVRPLANDGTVRLQRFCNNYISSDKKIVIFTELNLKTNIRRFMGILVLGTRIDREILKKISSLDRVGLRTIVFSGTRDIDLPKIPDDFIKLPTVSAEYMRKNDIPITYNFGKYMYYRDSNERDILELIDYAHAKKKRVAILGFSDYAAEAIEKADVFISCAPIRPKISGYLYEEIRSLDTEGGVADASCIQIVKGEADILVPRYNNGRGGFSSLVDIRKAGVCAYRNLKQFVRYMICVQFIRICVVAIPMLFGSVALDARHVMVCSFLMDLVALILFSISKDLYQDQNSLSDWWDSKIKKHIIEDKILFISALSAAAVLVILPRIFGLFGWGGQYLYEEGCSFSALVYLHLAVFFILRYGSKPNINKVLHDIPLFAFIGGTLIFLAFVFAVGSIRPILSLEMGNPFPYFLISFVPSCVFVFLYCYLHNKSSSRK